VPKNSTSRKRTFRCPEIKNHTVSLLDLLPVVGALSQSPESIFESAFHDVAGREIVLIGDDENPVVHIPM